MSQDDRLKLLELVTELNEITKRGSAMAAIMADLISLTTSDNRTSGKRKCLKPNMINKVDEAELKLLIAR